MFPHGHRVHEVKFRTESLDPAVSVDVDRPVVNPTVKSGGWSDVHCAAERLRPEPHKKVGDFTVASSDETHFEPALRGMRRCRYWA